MNPVPKRRSEAGRTLTDTGGTAEQSGKGSDGKMPKRRSGAGRTLTDTGGTAEQSREGTDGKMLERSAPAPQSCAATKKEAPPSVRLTGLPKNGGYLLFQLVGQYHRRG